MKPHQIKSVLLGLENVLPGSLVIGKAGHVGVVMGYDAPDKATQIHRRIIEQHLLILEGAQGHMAEAL